MSIISIEPTPSPNTMKINLTDSLPAGVRQTFHRDQAGSAPEPLNRLLEIEGVKSLYRAADFIALDRTPKGDWQQILASVRDILGAGGEAAPTNAADESNGAAENAFGEVQVRLQHFRGIPLQVRVSNGKEERRAALPQRFSDAAIRGAAAAPNLIKERSLDEWDVRYGELEEVLGEVVQELDASYSDEQLEQLVRQAAAGPVGGEAKELAATQRRSLSLDEAREELAAPDWKRRYAALQQLKPSDETLPLLIHALDDDQSTVRRLATVYLGDIKEPKVLPYLFRALQDPSASVRRTAGDTLSDLGDPAAQGAMIRALRDPNKLVRWRAARFLYEVGDLQALEALRQAEEDPEFEIRMQIRMALERIEGGQAAEGSVWQQMTRRER
ncbi:conserved virulence factor C family protein [Paenibacillus filicis]|uniref:Conserved virulence factor C family protein n=1 Tax=Paenibacillus gyeongsangnamensis TaxID=3388067 RepID=A0ABT4QBA1_9BACL|nr:conserved virulence factor C family protein [Paenibacillus filicis]MCZ8514094.1 conserved virulence factor C family protein [Paenibacillus filicis]